MKYGEQPAYPLQPTFNNEGQICNERYEHEGLTKREYFAVKAMQGLSAKNQGWDNMKSLAAKAVEIADELLAELERTTKW